MAIKINRYVGQDQLMENTYLIIDEATGKSAIIDPGTFPAEMRTAIDNTSGLEYIILTHAHGDHICELPHIQQEYPDAKLVIHTDERSMLEDSSRNMTKMLLGEEISQQPDITVSDGDIIKLGESGLKVLHTPGHTEGGMCILSGKTLFSGDTLFNRSVGRTDLDGGSWPALKDSIINKLFVLDDDVAVYPGHGPETEIGYEKKANPFV